MHTWKSELEKHVVDWLQKCLKFFIPPYIPALCDWLCSSFHRKQSLFLKLWILELALANCIHQKWCACSNPWPADLTCFFSSLSLSQTLPQTCEKPVLASWMITPCGSVIPVHSSPTILNQPAASQTSNWLQRPQWAHQGQPGPVQISRIAPLTTSLMSKSQSLLCHVTEVLQLFFYKAGLS